MVKISENLSLIIFIASVAKRWKVFWSNSLRHICKLLFTRAWSRDIGTECQREVDTYTMLLQASEKINFFRWGASSITGEVCDQSCTSTWPRWKLEFSCTLIITEHPVRCDYLRQTEPNVENPLILSLLHFLEIQHPWWAVSGKFLAVQKKFTPSRAVFPTHL